MITSKSPNTQKLKDFLNEYQHWTIELTYRRLRRKGEDKTDVVHLNCVIVRVFPGHVLLEAVRTGFKRKIGYDTTVAVKVVHP